MVFYDFPWTANSENQEKSLEKGMKNEVRLRDRLRPQFGEDFGSILAPFWRPSGSRNHPISLPEGIRTQLRIAIDFGCDFGGKPLSYVGVTVTSGDLPGGMRRAAGRCSRSGHWLLADFWPEFNTLLLP